MNRMNEDYLGLLRQDNGERIEEVVTFNGNAYVHSPLRRRGLEGELTYQQFALSDIAHDLRREMRSYEGMRHTPDTVQALIHQVSRRLEEYTSLGVTPRIESIQQENGSVSLEISLEHLHYRIATEVNVND